MSKLESCIAKFKGVISLSDKNKLLSLRDKAIEEGRSEEDADTLAVIGFNNVLITELNGLKLQAKLPTEPLSSAVVKIKAKKEDVAKKYDALEKLQDESFQFELKDSDLEYLIDKGYDNASIIKAIKEANRILKLPTKDIFKELQKIGVFNLGKGEKSDARPNLGLSTEEYNNTMKQLESGKETKTAERLMDYVKDLKKSGELKIIQGVGGASEKYNIPLYFNLLGEQANAERGLSEIEEKQNLDKQEAQKQYEEAVPSGEQYQKPKKGSDGTKFRRVYHGADSGFTIEGKRNRIMFTSNDKKYANYYANERGGSVFEFDIDESKIAKEDYVKEKIKALKLKTTEGSDVEINDNLHRLIDPRFDDTAISKEGLDKLFLDLEKEGYYGVDFMDENQDLGGRNEIKSTAIFNPKELAKSSRQPQSEYQQKKKESATSTTDVQKVVERMQKVLPKFKISYDDKLKAAGKIKGNEITINPFYAGKDTPIHEAGHALIDFIGYNDKVIQKAIEQLKSSPLWKETKERYPELNDEMLGKEVLAEAIGLEGADIFDTEVEKSKFKVLLDYIYAKLKQLLGIDKNIAKSLAKQIIGGVGTKNIDVKPKKETKSLFDKSVDLFYKIKDTEGAAKKRTLAEQRRSYLEANPSIKYIEDNIKSIYKQLEQANKLIKEGDCI